MALYHLPDYYINWPFGSGEIVQNIFPSRWPVGSGEKAKRKKK